MGQYLLYNIHSKRRRGHLECTLKGEIVSCILTVRVLGTYPNMRSSHVVMYLYYLTPKLTGRV